MLNQDKEIGGQPVHVRDCYVWAEICYLDSPTNYREYLPSRPVDPSTVYRDDLVMLDSSEESPNSSPKRGLAIATMFFIIAGLLLCLIMWLCA